MVFRFLLAFGLFLSLSPRLKAQVQMSTKSKRAVELYNEADNYRVHQQYDKAIDLLNQAISKDKDFEEAYYRLGVTFKNKGEIERSIEALEKGFGLTKDSRRQNPYRYELGDSYLRVGNYMKSSEFLTQFL